jgi:DNA-binding LytR/AlgR family response regulator
VNVLIIEDEPLAAENLRLLLMESDPMLEVSDMLDSVDSAVRWLNDHKHPELIFMDIHLGDGICFEIFKQVRVSSFIIFTTAYDQYALDAFKVNSVDYLLKPLNKRAIGEALEKFKSFSGKVQPEVSSVTVNKLLELIDHKKNEYKDRFVVKVGAHIRMIDVSEIACFYSLDKATYLVTRSGSNYLVDYPLERLLTMLDPARFYRINRKYIVEIGAIADVVTTAATRMRVSIKNIKDNELMVSRDRIKGFKIWLEG